VHLRIKKVLAVEGLGGEFYRDLEAIRQGAVEDGHKDGVTGFFTYRGNPITPGFTSINQPASATCIMLVMDNDQVAYGDCIGVAYSARMGRDTLLGPKDLLPLIEKHVAPRLEGKELNAFRPLAEDVDKLEVEGRRLHTLIRYGVTQALLDAVARARGVTMTEIITEEYDLPLIAKPVPLNLQVGYDWYWGVEKIILRRGPFIHCGSTTSMSKHKEQLNYVKWVRNRIQDLGGEDYKPTIHIDNYGMIGLAYNHDLDMMVDYLRKLEQVASPYPLIIEDPVNMGEKQKQIQMMASLRSAVRKAGLNIILMVDELCPRLEDHKDFAAAGAADMQKVKSPDLGGINNAIEAVLHLKSLGVMQYLGGSATETDRAAQVRVHIGLATQPSQMLASPSMMPDAAHCVTHNEMQRAIALMRWRGKIKSS
jgi:methylaspartate ammonia-lyase